MRVVMLALGSRGDVQPFLVLAAALRERGVDCVVVGLQDYNELADRAGVNFQPIYASLSDEQAPRTSGPVGGLALRFSLVQYLLLQRWEQRIAAKFADAIEHAVGPGDTVLAGILARDCATAAAEHHGGQSATVVFTGVVPTADGLSLYQSPMPKRTSRLNLRSSTLGWRMATGLSLPASHLLRRRWSLPVVNAGEATAQGDGRPTIVAVEPLLVPAPADWPPTVHQTGSLVAPLPDDWRPPTALSAFLGQDQAPVYVGFGSPGAGYRPVPVSELDDVARLTGRRIIAPAPPGAAPQDSTDRVLLIEEVPHEWLLRRTAAIVHHGGAGTTVAGLRAGVPSAAVSFIVDQPYHGRRLHQLGVGPQPLPRRRLTAGRLAGLITAMTSGPAAVGYRTRAAEVGRLMTAVDGVSRTVEELQKLRLLPHQPADS